MKSLFTALAVLTISFSSIAQSTDGKKIDQMVNRVIKGLQKFDTTNIASFRKVLISDEEIQDFITAMDADEEFKQEIRDNIKEGMFDGAMEASYRDFANETRRSGINWKKIKYENFLYEVRERDGLKQLRGELSFIEGENQYQVQLTAGLLNNKFVLIELEDFHGKYDMESEMDMMLREMEEALEEAAEEEGMEEDYEAEEELIERIREMEPEEEPREIYYEEELYSPESDMPIEAEIIDFPDLEASYPGGQEAMMKFVAENVVYPQEALDKGIQGKVYTSFIVEADGSLTNIEIMRGVSPEIDREAKRVIATMPKWIPGESGGKKIRTKVRIPITFQLD